MAYVLAFQSCYNKEPQTQQKHLFSYCLGGQSRKLMCQDAILPLKARGNKGRLLPCLSLLWEPAHNLWFLALKPYHVCLHNHLAFFPACLTSSAAARVAQRQRICLPVQEMWVWSLGQEDSLEKEWQPTPVSCLEAIHGVAESDMAYVCEHTHTHTHTHFGIRAHPKPEWPHFLTNYMYKDMLLSKVIFWCSKWGIKEKILE